MGRFSWKHQSGFRKGYNIKYYLLPTLQNYQRLLLVFHELLPAKLHAYGLVVLIFFLNYIFTQNQKLKRKKTYDNALPDYKVDSNRGNVKVKITIKEKLSNLNYVQN